MKIIKVLTFIILWFVVQDRIEKYPQLGTEWFPKTEKQRRMDFTFFSFKL